MAVLSHVAFFDGASKGNPGRCGAGGTVVDPDGLTVFEGSIFLSDRGSNNEAEYGGLVMVLDWCAANGVTHVNVYGDSLLVVSQVNGRWKVKAPNLVLLHAEARGLKSSFQSCTLEWVPRSKNAAADALANAALIATSRK
jgi:ribonuclease HI